MAALKPGVVIFELDVESEEPKPDRGTKARGGICGGQRTVLKFFPGCMGRFDAIYDVPVVLISERHTLSKEDGDFWLKLGPS